MGKAIVEKLRQVFADRIRLIAVGTNAIAAQSMMRAGADAAASGESAVVYNCRQADLIVGPIGILTAGSMMGEMSPVMAAAIAQSDVEKVLIPLSKCHLQVVGVSEDSLPGRLEQMVGLITRLLQDGE